MSQTIAVPVELVRRLVQLADSLGDPSFFSFENPEESPERVLLADSEVRVLCEWPVQTPPPEGEPSGPVELDPTHIAGTLAAILNAISELGELAGVPGHAP